MAVADILNLLKIPLKYNSLKWNKDAVWYWNKVDVSFEHKDIDWSDWFKQYIDTFNKSIVLKECFS
jgi:hypothetical protein